jgi:hypothetical protein
MQPQRQRELSRDSANRPASLNKAFPAHLNKIKREV